MKTHSYLFILLSILLTVYSCEKIPKDIPKCMRKEIKEFSKTQTSNKVDEYLFQGNHVYVFGYSKGCIDCGLSVMNANCDHLGTLYGFGGNYKINGVVFHEEAEFVRTVWEKEK